MKTVHAFLTVSILMFLFSVPAGAQGRFGAGFVFGEPTGIAWKYRINQVNAIDGAIGFSPFDRYRIHVDYLWHSFPFRDQNLSLHYGIGAATGFGRTDYIVVSGKRTYVLRNQEIGLGARAVTGLTYLIPKTPLDLFFELAPLIIFNPGTGMGIDVGFGGRFNF